MAGRAKDAPITTRNARSKLKARTSPYFRQFEGTVTLGYFKPATSGRPGSWIGRRLRADGTYETSKLGTADDVPGSLADGEATLNFEQAQAALRAWARSRASMEQAEREGNVPTLRSAVEAYIAMRERRDPVAGRDARLRLTRHVLGSPIAGKRLPEIKRADMVTWRSALMRGGRIGEGRPAAPMAPSTLGRLFNDLRAALNAAAANSHLNIAPLLTVLKAPPGADEVRDIQLLTDEQLLAVTKAAGEEDPDFHLLVLVLAATGARFGQVARAKVGDFQPARQRLLVPVSRKGNGTKDRKKPSQPIPLPDTLVAALQAHVAGRDAKEPLLLRWHHRKVSPSAETNFLTWVRDARRAWINSAEMTRPWTATLERAGLPRSFVPYALRHTAIVRALRANVPIRIVAAAHDTSVAMIERHYSAFVVDASEELLRRAMMPEAGSAVLDQAA